VTRSVIEMLRAALLISCALAACSKAAAVAETSSRPEPAAYGDKWLVILSSSRQKGEEPKSLDTLRKHPDLGTNLERLSSSQFRGLMPCFEIVVARAFADQNEAKAFSKRLKKLAVDNYVKNAGSYVGVRDELERYCERPPTRGAGCGDAHWVERHGERTFMMLPSDPVMLDRISVQARPPKMLDGDHRVWISPLSSKQIGAYRIGQTYEVRESHSDACSITRFALLTRGTPHFSYLQNAQNEPPTAPGCGSPELFAELDCAVSGDDLTFPRGGKVTRYSNNGPRGSLVEPVLAALRRSASPVTLDNAYTTAQRGAAERKAELREYQDVHLFETDQRRVGLYTLSLQTGEGLTDCGADDVRIDLAALVELSADYEVTSVLMPAREMSETISDILDVGADGSLELVLETKFPHSRELLPVSGGPYCGVVVPFCDCGC
jgi:hypothetical protein